MTNEQAGLALLGHFKRVFTQPGARQLKSAVSIAFIMDVKSKEIYENAMNYAVKEGWIRRDGMFLEFTQKGFDQQI